MSEATINDGGRERPGLWRQYCDAFPEASPSRLRPHCHPRQLLHSPRSKRALVLVHGLSDSPAMLAALADHFHFQLGYDVYLPLLQGHGLLAPQGMRQVTLEGWLANLDFAVASATAGRAALALGGLSTGGALSLYLAASGARPDADLYLFSPVLGLAPGPGGIPGDWAEWLLERSWVAAIDLLLGRLRPLVCRHPYRYDWVPLVSAAQLVRLMRRLDSLLPALATTLSGRIFAAWSESDQVVSVAKIADLMGLFGPERTSSFILSAAKKVAHASVVLEQAVLPCDGAGQPLEAANPVFAEMLAAIDAFSAGTSWRSRR